jgi:predicted permease
VAKLLLYPFSIASINVVLQIIYVFILIGFGFIFSRLFKISSAGKDGQGVSILTRLLMYFAYPSFIFTAMLDRYSVDLILENWILPVLGFAISVVGYIAGKIFLIFFKPNPDKQKAFLFNCTMSNYFFLPLPIVASICGPEGVVLLALMTIGSEVALWTLGTMSIIGIRFDRKTIKNLFSPALVALFISLFVAHWTSGMDFWNYRLAITVVESIRSLGACTIPLAMIIAGINIDRLKSAHIFNDRWVGLMALMRLVVIPFIVLTGLRVLPLQETGYEVASIVSVMPVAIAGALFVEHYGGDKEFIGASMLVTTLLVIITAPLLLLYAGV